MQFFDSLVHATRDGRWLGGSRYDASAGRLLREMEAVGDCRACLVAIAGHGDNGYMLELARLHPQRFVPIAGVDPAAARDEEEVTATVRKLSDDGFAGIKLHPRLNAYDPLDPRCFAAIDAAGQAGLIVFLDTLFRQRGQAMRHPVDTVDVIANRCTDTKIILLHGCGAHLLELFEMGRMHSHLLIDLSFTMMRYMGSSLDDDICFMCDKLDQRVSVGSDFPEYALPEVNERASHLLANLAPEKRERVLWKNLASLFALP